MYVTIGGLDEKDVLILELTETVEILQLKVQKLEQLIRLKDGKLRRLQTEGRGPAGPELHH